MDGCYQFQLYFQSPFHRGNGCYKLNGYWRLYKYANPFSPLFIGAMVATRLELSNIYLTLKPFSPLFIGAMVATMVLLQYTTGDLWIVFQSPFHRGNGCY